MGVEHSSVIDQLWCIMVLDKQREDDKPQQDGKFPYSLQRREDNWEMESISKLKATADCLKNISLAMFSLCFRPLNTPADDLTFADFASMASVPYIKSLKERGKESQKPEKTLEDF
ncbi:hypothetical protein WISP_37397 [Willisornis vidua]|uniref:Uncharacterized protein n=1 Tax=Willisornis vidua TaxID=1566151 RepID=A0ABQ9DNS3_9PASS|nr:hypothetical protein WISP_37397 [Willisornis vidua]